MYRFPLRERTGKRTMLSVYSFLMVSTLMCISLEEVFGSGLDMSMGMGVWGETFLLFLLVCV